MNDLIVNISLQNIPLQKRANLLTFAAKPLSSQDKWRGSPVKRRPEQ